MQVPSSNTRTLRASPRATPDPKFVMMAAAQMHSEGKLKVPDPDPSLPPIPPSLAPSTGSPT